MDKEYVIIDRKKVLYGKRYYFFLMLILLVCTLGIGAIAEFFK